MGVEKTYPLVTLFKKIYYSKIGKTFLLVGDMPPQVLYIGLLLQVLKDVANTRTTNFRVQTPLDIGFAGGMPLWMRSNATRC